MTYSQSFDVHQCGIFFREVAKFLVFCLQFLTKLKNFILVGFAPVLKFSLALFQLNLGLASILKLDFKLALFGLLFGENTLFKSLHFCGLTFLECLKCGLKLDSILVDFFMIKSYLGSSCIVFLSIQLVRFSLLSYLLILVLHLTNLILQLDPHIVKLIFLLSHLIIVVLKILLSLLLINQLISHQLNFLVNLGSHFLLITSVLPLELLHKASYLIVGFLSYLILLILSLNQVISIHFLDQAELTLNLIDSRGETI